MAERPPLANQIFQAREQFLRLMEPFAKGKPIFARLREIPEGESIETALEGLQNEAEEDSERYQQLAAVKFYLQHMLWDTQTRWLALARGITNYITLLDQIRHWRVRSKENVCIVTFNYDTLLEAALTDTVGLRFHTLQDYVGSETYKVVKLHGSITWAREIEGPIGELSPDQPWGIVRSTIERAPELRISDRYLIAHQSPIWRVDRKLLYPAIAIPVETKRNYECPEEHVRTLTDLIPRVTKVLLVGWRATERPFLELLTRYLAPDVLIQIVAGSLDGARRTQLNLEAAGLTRECLLVDGGFTRFATADEIRHLLDG